jgi:phage/plasmid-like protein (TIGR03299 family)
MAHMIETMAYAGATPWHGLGVPVDADIDVDDMLVRAGLDWGVEKVPLHIHRGGAEQMVPGQYALVRDSDDSVLSVVGSTYEPVQNRDAMEFFREFCDAGDMTLETAGSLSGGRRVWALASIRDGFQLAGGDEVSGYLLLTNPHARNEALVAQFTPVRVVCQNTLAMALRGGGSGVFRHRHMAAFDPERARQALGLARDQLASFHEAAEFLSGRRRHPLLRRHLRALAGRERRHAGHRPGAPAARRPGPGRPGDPARRRHPARLRLVRRGPPVQAACPGAGDRAGQGGVTVCAGGQRHHARHHHHTP